MIILRRVFKVIIAAFVIWQCIAVGLYSLIGIDGYPILEWLNTKRQFVRPYVLITSQWQRWNLFSPDPLRRVIAIDIDKRIDDKWTLVETIDEHTVSVWRRANELKVIRRMEDDKSGPLQQAYIDDVCRRHGISLETPMRMTRRWHVIPKNDETMSREWWDNWEPTWNANILLETSCSSTK